MSKLIVFGVLSINSFPTFKWSMLTRRMILSFKIFSFAVITTCNTFYIFLSILLVLVTFVSNNLHVCLVKLPHQHLNPLQPLFCSCAYKVFNNSAKVILERSLMFFKVVTVVSNLLGIMTNIFSTTQESLNSDPSNLTLFAMSRNISKYSLIDYDSLIFCNSKSLMRFNTNILLI